ncbi:prosalusin [Amia ocellicauda]|uniref:prosalusin n=1 Tax=Amia ocellicauda TaxID=2972642 RepID=UPI003463C364
MELQLRVTVLLPVLFVCFSNTIASAFQLKTIYCKISENCDCDFQPDIRGLEWDLYRNLYGQHLAQDVVSEAVGRFLRNESPDRPLVLSFHGSSGTGKTMVSSMLGKYLYGTSLGSPYVHQFIPTLHFPSPSRVKSYRLELKSWIEGNLTACARSIFIFDEMEKMPPGLVDILAPFLGPSHVVFQTNYRKAIYIFISSVGEEVINKLALENRLAGRERDEIRLEDLEDKLSKAAFDDKNSGFYHSSIISESLIAHFVPFLPLTRRHVERCARRDLCQRGHCHRTDVVEAVGGAMSYTQSTQQLFSQTGCKTVMGKINFYL